MKTIKIIDLLNKIANKEEVPEKVKFDGYIFEKDLETDYTCYVKSGEFKYLLNEVFLSQLNDEVEIIEKDKKIERITNEAFLNSPFGELVGGKFNEIIDYINKNEEEK